MKTTHLIIVSIIIKKQCAKIGTPNYTFLVNWMFVRTCCHILKIAVKRHSRATAN